MTPFLMRQLWSLIETAQTNILLTLDDASLERWLSHQLQTQRALNSEEICCVTSYIHSRLNLIRDIARDRQTLYQGLG